MLSRGHPDVVDYLGGGCLLDYLDEASRSTVVLACGDCALNAFNDVDRITNLAGGYCGNSAYGGEKMTTSGEDEF